LGFLSGKDKSNRRSFDCVTRECASYFAQDDTFLEGLKNKRNGRSRSLRDDKQKGKGNSKGNGNSRFPLGMTSKKAETTAEADGFVFLAAGGAFGCVEFVAGSGSVEFFDVFVAEGHGSA
jgi:hypothetical protein